MKEKLTFDVVCGSLLGLLSWLFGSLDQAFYTFLFFMVVDYVTGMVAAYITGSLQSRKGWNGIFKKAAALILVAVIYQADANIPAFNGWESPLRDIVIYALAINDLISIVENLGEWGLKIPKVIAQRLEQLKGVGEE